MAEIVYMMSSSTKGGWERGKVYIGEVGKIDGKDVIIFHGSPPMDYTQELKNYVRDGFPIDGRRYTQEQLHEVYKRQNPELSDAAAAITSLRRPRQSVNNDLADEEAADSMLGLGGKRTKRKPRKSRRKSRRQK